MKKLNELELKQINGGIGLGWLATGLFVGISFISGILSGQIKLKWQNHKNTEFKGNSEENPLIRIRRKD